VIFIGVLFHKETYLSVEESTKYGSLSSLSLSRLDHLDRLSVSSKLKRHKVSMVISTNSECPASLYKNENRIRSEKESTNKNSKEERAQENQGTFFLKVSPKVLITS
jgi:site-specific DNA-adenine methylase